MNKKIAVAIPIAGQSTRFQKHGYNTHKAFLPLNKNCILENIILQFDSSNFDIYIICTEEQLNQNNKIISQILSKHINVKIQKIKKHSLGPTYSVLNCVDIDDDIPIVVHYCDFLVRMDMNRLTNLLSDNNIVAPYFSGFHPASLGTTTFAYMKVDQLNNMIALKEKESFTNDRIQEPCSTGIYAFPTFNIFKKIATKLLDNPGSWGQKEAYTSLCLNIAIKQFYKVVCLEVENFICLGTPRDYEEYSHWRNLYLCYRNHDIAYVKEPHLITAAGKGSRFKKYGYLVDKIFLDFQGYKLIEQSFSSLNNNYKFLAALKTQEIYFDDNLLDSSSKLFLDDTPNGQLLTLNMLVNNYSIESSFFVSSADYKFHIDISRFYKFINQNNPDIIILTTKWKYFSNESTNNYGFLNLDKNSRVTNIIEKEEIDINSSYINNLLIGTFWFKDKSILSILSDNNNQEGEQYIAKNIGSYLSTLRVFAFEVDYWLSLGTPKELFLAQYWFNYFDKISNLE
ncbi:sugar phosphate nucleotidyltransferase [Prochlorococcus marinus]|uniref:sugar phosphate nucleotidyltransferase n=1 Tax=Prochlorococcus marinus TaxID=1219 RepID=UPI0022B590DB|nr:sugar phosphate nucleotidyltransferase [Prochlorococcus marinus]